MEYILDRFEGELAILEDDAGVRVSIARSRLPLDVREGDVLRDRNGVFSVDAVATEARRARIRAHMSRMRLRATEKNDNH